MVRAMGSRRVVQVVRVMLVLVVGVGLIAYAVSHRGSARKDGVSALQATADSPSSIFTSA
jgi:hypothetical protein